MIRQVRGIASGPVKILKSVKEMGKIESGDPVIHCGRTNESRFVQAMEKSCCYYYELRGGRTSHAAIVSRGINPAVVGTKGIMSLVKDGMVLTVNGTTGEIYGKIPVTPKPVTISTQSIRERRLKLPTKVYVNLAEPPSRAAIVTKMNADGVGLLKARIYDCRDIGTHPKKLIEEHERTCVY